MTPGLALALALAPSSPTVLSARDPAPIGLLHVTPTGEAGRVSRSEVIHATEEVFEARTELAVELLDPSVNRDCQGRLACIARRLRVDRPRDPRPLAWLLVLTQVSLEGEADRFSATLVDLEGAPSVPLEDPGPDDPLEVGAELRLDTVSVRASAGVVDSVEDLADYLCAALDGPFRDALAERGALRAEGRVEVVIDAPGAVVHLDERPLGAIGPGGVVVERVRVGSHRLRISGAQGRTFEASFILSESVDDVRLAGRLPGGDDAPSLLRPSLGIAGGVVAATGAALVIWAAARNDPRVRTACFASSPGCEPGVAPTGFAYAPQADDPAVVSPGGLGPASLGAALLVGGLGVALGSWLEDGRDVPWVSLGLSSLAAGALLGASLLVDGGRLP